MDSAYGKLMGSALGAVLRMQADSVKLLRDLDRKLDGYHPLLGNVVTLDVGSSINRQSFMAEGLLRHYSKDRKWGSVLGVNICYFDAAKPERLPEPILVAANLQYFDPEADAQEKLKRSWDPWYAFLEWAPEQRFGAALSLQAPFKNGNLQAVTVAAAPLFSITSLEAAVHVIDLVGRP